MKLCFLGKIRGKTFLTQIWVFGSKKLSTGPQLSEYVWVVCRNTKGTCLKSVSKTPTFQGFTSLKETFAHIQPNGQFLDSFWIKWAKRDFFSKKRLEHFFAVKSPN